MFKKLFNKNKKSVETTISNTTSSSKHDKASSKKKNKLSQDIPESLKKYNFRISTPYGLYPEDVDVKLNELDVYINRLVNENNTLQKNYNEVKQQRDAIKAEFANLQIQMSLLQTPKTSIEEDLENISKITKITAANVSNNVNANITQPHELLNQNNITTLEHQTQSLPLQAGFDDNRLEIITSK